MRRYVLGDVQSEDMFINGMWFLVSILYTHSVVGGVVYCTVVIYGARIHRTVALLRVCEWIQLWNLSAWVKFARGIFGEILY